MGPSGTQGCPVVGAERNQRSCSLFCFPMLTLNCGLLRTDYILWDELRRSFINISQSTHMWCTRNCVTGERNRTLACVPQNLILRWNKVVVQNVFWKRRKSFACWDFEVWNISQKNSVPFVGHSVCASLSEVLFIFLKEKHKAKQTNEQKKKTHQKTPKTPQFWLYIDTICKNSWSEIMWCVGK